jgi:hypothetical protein
MFFNQDFWMFYLMDEGNQLPPPGTQFIDTEDLDQIMTEDNRNLTTES